MGVTPAITLGVGVALYLLDDVWHSRSLSLPAAQSRVVAAALSLATIALGPVSALLQLGSLVVALVVVLGIEHRWTITKAGNPLPR
ncbi:MAG: hypothetical protein ACRDVZ_04770 [Jiangellaceae bacterium]